jgi:uncharacterized OB-fold protein
MNTTVTTRKPVPTPDAESGPFWAGAARHELMVQICRSCGTRRLPATTYCPSCQSGESEWLRGTGLGRVFSWIVVHHPVPKEAYGAEVPYVVALITLDEGPRIASNIVGCAPGEVQADMRVEVTFEDRDGVSLPLFRPVSRPAQ